MATKRRLQNVDLLFISYALYIRLYKPYLILVLSNFVIIIHIIYYIKFVIVPLIGITRLMEMFEWIYANPIIFIWLGLSIQSQMIVSHLWNGFISKFFSKQLPIPL